MGDSNGTRVQIIVAVIGLIGVLGAAVITNWNKFSNSDADTASSPTQTKRHNTNDKDNSGGQEQPKSADFARVISASLPGPPSFLQRGQIMDFDVRVEYSVSSFEDGWLSVSAVEFPSENGGCSGKGGRIVADDEGKINVRRGRGEAVVSVRWYGDEPSLSANEKLHSMKGLGSGFVGLRPDLLSSDQKFYLAGKLAPLCYPFH